MISGRLGLVLISALAATALLASRSRVEEVAMEPNPPITLWAWERPERLGFVDPKDVEAAILVGTLNLSAGSIQTHPRLQPLELPRTARRIAVVRIEASRSAGPLTPVQRRQAAAATLAWARSSPGYDALQIDFDATVSQRDFYRRLLEDLRRELPETMPISITALASWCLGDRWLDGLPIDEAIPMLFRMGTDERAIRTVLARGDDFREPLCLSSYGLATDEPIPPLRSGRRLYLFHPKPWTETAFSSFQQDLLGDVP